MPDIEDDAHVEHGEQHHLVGTGNVEPRRIEEPGAWLLKLGRGANAIAGLSALAALVAHAMSLSSSSHLSWTQLDAVRTGLLRLYCIAIAVLVMAVETEWEALLVQMKVLESWVGRGLLQVFLGLMTLELEVEGSSDFDKSLRLYRQAVGLAMTGCGAFYIVGGLTCIGVCKRSRQRRHMDRVKAERDLATLLKQQEELRGRLAVLSKT